MKVETIEGAEERRCLIHLITDKAVLARLTPVWDRGLFASPWANAIAGWCVRHFRKYGEAPGRGIEAHYSEWLAKQSGRNEELGKAMGDFLSSLSAEYEEDEQGHNSALSVDRLCAHLKRVRLTRIFQEGLLEVQAGQVERAEGKVLTYGPLPLGEQAGVDPLLDDEEVAETFSHRDTVLVEYKDGLKEFYADSMCRDGLFAYLAPEKTGKSFLLIDLAWRAMLQRRRVAFFSVGDMSKRQVKRRLYARAAEAPLRSPNNVWPYTLRVPTSISRPRKGEAMANLKTTARTFDAPLAYEGAREACRQVMREQVRSDESYFRLAVYPNSTINVEGIKGVLQGWDLHGFSADVVVIDYADILAPPAGRFEPRDAINETWKQLRALSQERHCLVATATQANREGYDRALLDRRNISDDKRKLAHVTGMAGINVVGKEKELGLFRLNWIALREGEYTSRRVCHVAGCLPLCAPCILSVF